MGVFALAVSIKLINTQIINGDKWREKAEETVIRNMNIPASRGNIYASDGNLLATSMPVYDIWMDPYTVEDGLFNDSVAKLSKGLASLFADKSARDYEQYLRKKRNEGNRYVKLQKGISYLELQKLKSLAIFNQGKYKGGLIYEQRNIRKKPLGKIAERTIGYSYSGGVGLEGSYDNELKGKDGRRLKQKISDGIWKPLNDNNQIEPIDGSDIVSTIDTRIQDVAHFSLLKYLERYEADHGCAIVMEVATGEIKAVVNLGRTDEGKYYEKRNYAVYDRTEPGSTFKLASVIRLLEDGLADTSDRVDTENGTYKFYDQVVRDSRKGGYGIISLREAFEVSSNVGIARMVNDAYGKNPSKFVDGLYKMGLHKPLGVKIKGEQTPIIPKPSDRRWSGVTLPWMSYGYEVSMTPLQVLTFYNAIANNGQVVKPHFVKEIRKRGKTIRSFEPEIINPSICSQQTINQVKVMMEGVVLRGTATNIRSSKITMAGKTGTCQLNYWKKDEEKEYQASFAGYFPADNPKYSCIVVVNKPNPEIGYYGSHCAAPVFSEIAHKIYVSTPAPQEIKMNAKNLAQKMGPIKEIETSKNTMPNLTGLPLMDAIPLLENMGIKVKTVGEGKIKKQAPKAGEAIKPYTTVYLQLG